MMSPGHLPLARPSIMGGQPECMPKFVPTEDMYGAPDFSNGAADPGQEDLRDLLHDIRGDVGPRWTMDAPSFEEMEPTQGCFPSATIGWGSGGIGAFAFGAGPSETFGAFAQHQGQITDTAGTPFHPATMPMPYGHPMQMAMMPPPQGYADPMRVPPPNPWGMAVAMNMAPGAHGFAFAAPNGGFAYGPPPPANFAPPPPPQPPPGTAAAATAAGPYPMQYPTFMHAPAVAQQRPQPTANLAVVPNSAPTSLMNAGNTDGNSSGDEVAHNRSTKLHRRPGSMCSSDSGQGLQVVPDQAMNPAPQPVGMAAYTPIPPPPYGDVVFMPCNGGFIAVRRPLPGGNTTTMQPMHASPSVSVAPPVGSNRAACLARYRQKKAVRSYSKNIRYHMRKVNADRRPRVKGRFIKASAAAEVAETLNNEMDAGESS